MTSPPAFTHGQEHASHARKARFRSCSATASLTRSTNTLGANSTGVGKRLMNQIGAVTTSSLCARSDRDIMEGVRR